MIEIVKPRNLLSVFIVFLGVPHFRRIETRQSILEQGQSLSEVACSC